MKGTFQQKRKILKADTIWIYNLILHTHTYPSMYMHKHSYAFIFNYIHRDTEKKTQNIKRYQRLSLSGEIAS